MAESSTRILGPKTDKKQNKFKQSSKKPRRTNKKRRRSTSSSSSSSSSSASSLSSHFAGPAFREATRTRSRPSQENLIRFARQHPGKLACATMQTWDQLSTKAGRTYKYAKTSMPTCTTRFFLNVLQPKEAERNTLWMFWQPTK